MPTSVRSRGYLPHLEDKSPIYFVTFRLADSLPRELLLRLRQERENIDSAADAGTAVAPDRTRLEKLRNLLRKAERYLDGGLGACHMRDSRIAKLVADALQHFDGTRYRLLVWCIMPNHVHVVFSPFPNHTLESIVHSWKSFSALAANRMLRRSGPFWQREYFDHLVRDDDSLLRITRYVKQNPAKAGLQNWPWVGFRTAGFQPASSETGRQDRGVT